jgi:hypothetical protein
MSKFSVGEKINTESLGAGCGQARWHCGRKHRFALIFFGTFLDQAKKGQ